MTSQPASELVDLFPCLAFLQRVVRIPSGQLSGTPPLQIRKRQTELLNPDH